MRKNKYTIIEIERAMHDMKTSYPLDKSIKIFNYLYGINHWGKFCTPCTNEIRDEDVIGECEYKAVAVSIPERTIMEIMRVRN